MRGGGVRGYAEAVEEAREEGKAMLPGNFEALDVGTGAVDRLEKSKSRVRIGWTEEARSLVNRIGQLFVKVSALQDAERLEVVFDQDVVIVGLGRFQVV